jgi:hypothetical protein
MSSPFRGPQWTRVRREILERDEYRCRVHGPHCKGRATEVDHIIPWRDGGAWFDPANLRAACDWCNTWRAQRQKSRDGWKRAKTHITLVMGPAERYGDLEAYVEAHAGPADLVIDYNALARAIGDRPDEIKKLRGSLLTKLRRGDVTAPRAWITSANPQAAQMFPYHQVVAIGTEVHEAAGRREW